MINFGYISYLDSCENLFPFKFDIKIYEKKKMSENNQSRGSQQQQQGGRGRSGRGRSRRGGGGGGSAKPSNDANHNERQRLYSECSEDHCAVCLNRLVIFAVGRCNHPGSRFNKAVKTCKLQNFFKVTNNINWFSSQLQV